MTRSTVIPHQRAGNVQSDNRARGQQPAAGAAAARGGDGYHAPPGQDMGELRKRAVNLFTFLRELVSLRTTVVRNCSSYEKVMWMDQVPKDADCDCIVHRSRKDDDEEWWLRVRKPAFMEPPALPPELVERVDPVKLADSSQAPPAPVLGRRVRKTVEGDASAAAPDVLPPTAQEQELKKEWDKYLTTKWTPWAEEDRRKRKVLKIYTDLFSLYQQQKELGEAYEVIIAMGQLRWAPKAGVEVNRHLVAVQTSIEFDAQRGVITVVPAAEGGKPRLEEDMLELDERPSPDVLTALEQQVASCDDDVWHNETMTNALKVFVHSLGSGDGTFTEDLAPVDKATNIPQVHWAPAVIVRRRTDQGLLQAYGKILEDLKKRPDVPQGLVPLIEVGWQAREGEATRGQTISETAEGLVFPLPSNDEQRTIVHQLQTQSGVVVQGPPGTGKSHTIANLVCHLLATGNRVLVTSHAPRALRILKDKIPPAITNMCVVLLGNDRTAMTELESSVQVITQQLNTWNPTAREAAITELEAQLATLRGRAREVDKCMRSFRETDTVKHPELPGGFAGTLQQIAQALRLQQARHGWIGQYTAAELEQLPEAPGLSDAEAMELLKALRAVDEKRRKDMQRELIPDTEAVSPDDLERMINEEEQWKAAAEQSRASSVGDAPLIPGNVEADENVLKELCDILEQIVRHNTDMASSHFSWVPRLARDIRSGQYEQWKTILEQTMPKIAAIRQQPEAVYELEVIGLGNVDVPTLYDDIEMIFQHLERGGKLTSFFRYVGPAAERRYIFDNVRIGGRRVKGMDALMVLRAWADVQYQLHSLRQLWSDISEAPQGPVVRRVPTWNAWCEIIQQAQMMHTAIQRAHALFTALSIVKLPNWHEIEQVQALHKQMKVLVMHKEHLSRRRALDVLADRTAKRGATPTAHPVIAKVAEAIRRRDLLAYRSAHTLLKDLWAERESWAKAEELLKRLAERLPKAAAALSDDPCDAVWEARMTCLNEAWLWLRADRWLKKQLDPRHFEYLQSERKSLQEHIQGTMVKLAAEKAWYHCMSRMSPTEETYLKAWMQAIRNIGAGTGKRADRFRKVARQTLEKCRSAIPAWIMPIHRVAETVVPGEDRFDVVIVDEASQSGSEALFLHYIAKKIIIVGDDKQIAPYNVGINRDDVELLRSRHIQDLPLSDYFDLEHSFFDQAYLRFGNRIRLCEHFRCMPEIIQFSNDLCYSNEPLLPLRQYGDARLEPVVIARHVSGHMEGTSPSVSNKAEAEAIVKQISKMVTDPAYKEKTFGVISMLGEKQAKLIEQKLLAAIGPEEMERRRLICGDAYSFQGDERHVMFISLVVAADEERRLATLTQAADERRFNVAASRARDQMWLFHSVMPDDLSSKCLRRKLLEYCLNPHVPEDVGEDMPIEDLERAANSADRSRVPAPPPFESWLEVDVYLQIRRRGYRVLPQHTFAGYKIDLVISGTHGRMAVECDGEDWHGQDRYDNDMSRQRQLERCGWRFWHVRGGAFYRNPDATLQPLWDLLEKQNIKVRTAEERATQVPRPGTVQEDEEEGESGRAPAKKKAPAKKTATRRSSSEDAPKKGRNAA